MKRSSRVWIAVILVLVLVGVLVAYSRRRPVPDVEAYQVRTGDIDAAITTNGKVEPVSPFEMRALIESHVTSVPATEGQSVKKGQLILTLDDAAVSAQLAQARAQLVSDQDALRVAKSGGKASQLAELDSDIQKDQLEITRQQNLVASLEKLVAQQAATQQELTNARVSLAAVQSDMRRLQATRADVAREAGVDTSKLELAVQQDQDAVRDLSQKVASTRVIAPANGTLYSLPFKLNDPVHPGDLVAAAADLKQIRVRAFVDEPELGGVEAGQTALVTWDALPNRTWTGQTTQIPREVVARNTRSVGEVLCSVDNSDQRLIPNINVNVRIEERHRTGVLVIPRGAVIFSGSHRYVFTVPAGDADAFTNVHRKEIHVGSSNASDFEVVSGLSAGDLIAVPGNFELKDEMRVHTTQPE